MLACSVLTGVSITADLFSSPVPTKPVSPYGAYNGQVRGCVYQPTEIALIAKGLMKASVRAHVLLNVPMAFLDPTSLLVSTDGPGHNDPSGQNPNHQPRKWRLPATPSWAPAYLSGQSAERARELGICIAFACFFFFCSEKILLLGFRAS